MTPTPTSDRPRGPWRWVHFYFVLALFDLGVIIASIFLHHRTLGEYQVALGALGGIDRTEQWIGMLHNQVIALNAPGNDVFASRDPAAERERSRELSATIAVTLADAPRFDIDVSAVAGAVHAMTSAQSEIFAIFDQLTSTTPGTVDGHPLLQQASATMATMDRHQADALDILDTLGTDLRAAKSRLYDDYGRNLQQLAAIERGFLVIVVFILLGMLWYGRKLHRTHEAFRREQERVEEERQARLAAIGELCSAFAHGIRNPLASITSSAQIALKYPAVTEPVRSRLGEVLAACNRLNRRCSRVLEFARAPTSAFEAYDLVKDIHQAIDEIRPRLTEHRIQVDTQFTHQRLPAFGDRERLVQSFIELLSNAIDHVPAGGRVTISGTLDPLEPGCARIDVVDDGPGIPEHLHAQVFDLFFTSKPDGGGVGLASVKRGVDLHGGSIRILPTAQGTHFRILLPLEAV